MPQSQAAEKLTDKLTDNLQDAGAAAADSAASASAAVADMIASFTNRFNGEASPSPTGGSIVDDVKVAASEMKEETPSMLSRDKLAENVRDAGAAAAESAASVSAAVADMIWSITAGSSEPSPTPKEGNIVDKVKDAASGAGSYVAEKVGDAAQASADMLSNLADAALDDTAGDAQEGHAVDSDEQELPNAAQVVLDAIKGKLGGKAQETEDDEELAYNMHGDRETEDGFDAKKPGEVLGAFADYISGKPTIWSSDMTEEVRRAKEDAEKLFKTDPVKAAKKAKQMEEWLHTNLDIDKEKMAEELGADGLEKLESLQKILKQRIEQREASEKHKIPRHEEL